MKKHFYSLLALFTAMAMSCSMVSCGDDPIEPEPEPEVPVTPDTPDDPEKPDTPDDPTPTITSQTFTVNGVTFKMIDVQGGTFTMGATEEQGSDAFDDAKPTHSVTLSDFAIGETEVTQELWEAVMGTNPSSNKGLKKPVDCISWLDSFEFLRRLNKLTGQKFRFPTEAEWEYAARGGKYSKGYKYSGSNNVDEVAWYSCDIAAVATKKANELGIYDMSGNVNEWCHDWYGNYSSAPQTNPVGPDSGNDARVNRGGCVYNEARGCIISARGADDQDYSEGCMGLRIALGDAVELTAPVIYETFTVKGISFNMIEVAGGTFTMGATPEQGTDAEAIEKPTHSVTLDDYYIGQTEVTQELWNAVMGWGLDSSDSKKKPIHGIRWTDCEEFIKKLNELTGKTFRMPTEAEWEYAARGGKYSKGYKYSGSDNIDEVAWYMNNSSKVENVATKKANEIGIYDMSGNVGEWCSDWLGKYTSEAQTNPTGTTGDYKCYRGMDIDRHPSTCRVSFRGGYYPEWSQNNFSGFRLAM